MKSYSQKRGNDHTYMIYNTSCTWTEAKAKCEKEGGHLVTVTSKAENDMLTGRVSDNQKKLYWISLSRERVGKAWKWVTRWEEYIQKRKNTNLPKKFKY